MVGVPYFLEKLLCVQACISCHRIKNRDPNCMMMLSKNTSPVCPPGAPPLAPLDANTHAGVHLASATSNSSGGLSGAHRFVVIASSSHVVIDTTYKSSHINSNKYFFSSFNDADPSHIMLVDCCMFYCRECGPISAVGMTPPPWSISLITFYPILPSYFI
jgi:hypothetical protein